MKELFQLIPFLPRKFLLIALGILKQSLGLCYPLMSAWMINELVYSAGASFWVLCIPALYLLGILFLAIETNIFFLKITLISVRDFDVSLKMYMWDHYRNLPVNRQEKHPPSTWLHKLTNDISVVVETVRSSLDVSINVLLYCFGTLLIVLIKEPCLLFIFILMASICIFSYYMMRQKNIRCAKKSRSSHYKLAARLFDMLAMSPLLKLMGNESHFVVKLKKQIHNTLSRQMQCSLNHTKFSALLQFEVWIATAIVTLASIYLYGEGKIPIGDVVLYGMLVAQMAGGLTQLLTVLPGIDMGLECARSLNETFFESDSTKERNVEIHAGAIIGMRNSLFVELDKVYFRYDKKFILNEFSMKIFKGEHVCLSGPNGSGKSTIIKLILGWYIPEKGCVSNYCENISLVPQKIIVFHSSLYENISLGDTNIGFKEIESVIRQCRLDKFIDCSPDGILTVISSDSLSGGELQCLGIARALIKKPDLLIVDEINNNLDIEAQKVIKEVLLSLKGSCSILSVTHDSEYAQLADRFYVVDYLI